jgi:hypothetical protein
MRKIIFSTDMIWISDLSACLFLLEIQLHVVSLSTPDEVWTKLEVLFGIKEYCEECMPENAKTKPQENPLEEQASQLPPEEDFRDKNKLLNFSASSDHISYMISKSDSKVHEHACVDKKPRPKWAQSILPTVDYLVDDPVDPRRMRSQFEEDPHALITIKPIIPMHFYMVLASDP